MSSSSLPVRRFLTIAAILICALVADTVMNDLNVHEMTGVTMWGYPATVPRLNPPGADLRVLMTGARQMADGKNPYATAGASYAYPPFAAAVTYPFTLLPDYTAFVVQYWILIAFNVLSIGILGALLLRSSWLSSLPKSLLFPVFGTGSLITIVYLSEQLHGYGLEFALERGNFDGYVLFSVTLAIASMIIWPEKVFLPIVLLSFATHLKIYPGLLLILPLLQAWRRSIVPLVAVNLAMLGTFGIHKAQHFFAHISVLVNNAYYWPGNHSIAAYVDQVIVAQVVGNTDSLRKWSGWTLTLIVAALWAHGMIRLALVAPLARRWLMMAALSFPVMGAVTSTSHDYKLVIYVLPMIVCAYYFAESYVVSGSILSGIGLILVLGCGVAIDRSTILPQWPFLLTKFPLIMLLQVLVYAQTYLCRSVPQLEPSAPATAV